MAVVPILQATSNTFLSWLKSPLAINQSVAFLPPGRKRVLPKRARKLCPTSSFAIPIS